MNSAPLLKTYGRFFSNLCYAKHHQCQLTAPTAHFRNFLFREAASAFDDMDDSIYSQRHLTQ